MNKQRILFSLATVALGLAAVRGTSSFEASANLSAEPFLGEIMWVPYDFEPRDWAFCNGQLLPVHDHPALFSLLGTTYGGDGRTSFALPDLRGRVPVHSGDSTGPGLSFRGLGEMDGQENVTLDVSQLPSHRHDLLYSTSASPGEPQTVRRSTKGFSAAPAEGRIEVTEPVGADQPHPNMQPYLGLNAVISLTGTYPSRF